MDEITPTSTVVRRPKWAFLQERIDKMLQPDVEGNYIPVSERLDRQMKACFKIIVASVLVLVLTIMLLVWIYKSQLTTTRGYAKYGTSHVPRARATWTPQVADVASRTRCLPFTDEELASNRSAEGYRLNELASAMCALIQPEEAIAAVELGVDTHRCAVAFKKDGVCTCALNPVYAPPWYSFPGKTERVSSNPMCMDARFVREYPSFAAIAYKTTGGAPQTLSVAGPLSVRILESIALQNGDFPCPVK